MNSIKAFNEEIVSIVLKFFQNSEDDIIPNSFFETKRGPNIKIKDMRNSQQINRSY
jgi:hypothetical protein